MGEKPIGGIRLSGGSTSRNVLIKFMSRDPRVVPVGIEAKEKPLRSVMTLRQKTQGVGRGENVIYNLPLVGMSLGVLEQLPEHGFVPSGVHAVWEAKDKGGRQYTVNFGWKRREEFERMLEAASADDRAKILANVEIAMASIAERASRTWQWHHMWDNPPPRADTIELVDSMMFPEEAKAKPPRHLITVVEGDFLTAVPNETTS
ncbi:MAG: hypothetical protein HY457_00095 [Parcubacteria group bacterium]|nr:hypothetical protein [Parcubacteria group bacterium]